MRFRNLLFLILFLSSTAYSQRLVSIANIFINSLDSSQKLKAIYPFDVDERYSFHYFPIENRKGIPLNELKPDQRQKAFDLMNACLSKQTVKKAKDIMALDAILKQEEHRNADDHFRDPERYYFAIFGIPAKETIWGWRVEGHHVSYNFSVEKNQLVSGTPGFLGANPAIVQEGPNKGEQVLKDETEMGFAFLHSLSAEQLQSAIISKVAPGDIITYINRKAMIEHPEGVLYSNLNAAQQQLFLELVNLYIHRYTKLFADKMLKEIQEEGLDHLQFAWAGDTENGIGHPHYYRIQGPTIIIEYDNTQNNANHVHTVVRDLKNDYGGDLLLEHYRSSH